MVRERWLLSRRELFQCLRRSVRSPLSHDGTSGDLEETPAHRASRRAHRDVFALEAAEEEQGPELVWQRAPPAAPLASAVS